MMRKAMHSFTTFAIILVALATLQEVSGKVLGAENISDNYRCKGTMKPFPNEYITNISIVPYLDERKIARMNISLDVNEDNWDANNLSGSIRIANKNISVNCHRNYQNLFTETSFTIPSLKASNPSENDEISVGCEYVLSIELDDWCMIWPNTFKFPNKQVEDELQKLVDSCKMTTCSCDQPKATLDQVEEERRGKFKVKWNPGQNTLPYSIEDITFFINTSNSQESQVEVENYYANKYSLVDLSEVEQTQEFTLIARFKTESGCYNYASISYSVSPSPLSTIVIGVTIPTILIIIILVGVKIICSRSKKTKSSLFSKFQIDTLQPLTCKKNEAINESYFRWGVEEIIEDPYEFPRERLTNKEKIGQGQFGDVFSAKAHGMKGSHGLPVMVAVKTLKEYSNGIESKLFMAEIDVFKKIGDHPNIIKLLGYCTIELPYIMIMELAPCGDLHAHLIELREQWLKLQNNQYFFSDNDELVVHQNVPAGATNLLDSRPENALPTPLLADLRKSIDRVLDNKELQDFALQIVKGMAHLESKQILHRDLAARNILINQEKILKISDFGLSTTGNYTSHSQSLLPWRWMAIESMMNNECSSKSDVWSFGVVLWEIGTLGAFPYEDISDKRLPEYLRTGGRLRRPEICTDELHSIMLRCWDDDPSNRPMFKELVGDLDVKKNTIYVNFKQLNNTYTFPPTQ